MLNRLFGYFYDRFRYGARSSQWPKVRAEHIKNNPNCAACGRSKKVEVHHIQPYHLRPDLELSFDNLITLCDDPCHFVFGHLMNYKSWNINVVQDCKIYFEKIRQRP